MRVLVVEDEAPLRRTLVRALREEGHVVEESGDGAEALLWVRHTDFDLVLLDVMLPKVDGWDLLRALRQRGPTPVLMLTARDAVADRVKGLDLGSDDYLVKPFELPELLARERLYEHLFPDDHESASNLLEVYVCNLRRKLGKDLVFTRRGLGYTLPAAEAGPP